MNTLRVKLITCFAFLVISLPSQALMITVHDLADSNTLIGSASDGGSGVASLLLIGAGGSSEWDFISVSAFSTTPPDGLADSLNKLNELSFNASSGTAGGHIRITVTETYDPLIGSIAEYISLANPSAVGNNSTKGVGGDADDTATFISTINGLTILSATFSNLTVGDGNTLTDSETVTGVINPITSPVTIVHIVDIFHDGDDPDGEQTTFSFTTTVDVPEPASLALLGLGLLGLSLRRRIKV